ncbi:MAG: GGDEF domain-containing protein [Silanimonas sp.]|nr:GGDEF domain-containing protein [Silanimonas sp.]
MPDKRTVEDFPPSALYSERLVLDAEAASRSMELMLEAVPRSLSFVDNTMRTQWANPQSADQRPLPADALIRMSRREPGATGESPLSTRLTHGGSDVTFLNVSKGVLVVAERDRSLASLAEYLVHRLVSETVQSREPIEVIRSALGIVRETLGWRWAAVTEFVEPIGSVEVVAFVDRQAVLPDGWLYDVIGTPCHHVFNSADAVFLDQLQASFADEPSLVDLGASVYVGMVYRAAGRAVGHLFLMNDEAIDARARQEATTLVRVFSAFLGPRLELLRAYRDLASAKLDAQTDALTGLGNRRAFDDAIGRIEGLHRRGALKDATLCIFDLDGLKRINDREGHQEGDRLIAEAARLLRESSRRDDLLFRLGGDEFALLISSDAVRFRESWDQRVTALNIALDRIHPGAGISGGLARLVEARGDVRVWVQLADEKMYRDKGRA